MSKAQLITIGTEITSGEVVNTNAAWISTKLEDLGVRVFSHLSVRDQRDEILKALSQSRDYDLIIVTGGLGPTSDDITRACVAEYMRVPLEFDEKVWEALVQLYRQRGLPLREAHRQQCHFPRGSKRLKNPIGTALGFSAEFETRPYFVLPGPPRELEGMWQSEVYPELQVRLPKTDSYWRRWTCLGAPESEVAELVENCIANTGLEVGYRAAVPYVKVKLYSERSNPEHRRVLAQVDAALAPFLVAEGTSDLAEELLERWPLATLRVRDGVCGGHLAQRLFGARRTLEREARPVPSFEIESVLGPDETFVMNSDFEGVQVTASGDGFHTHMIAGSKSARDTRSLPFQLKLATERGRLTAAEWAIWTCVKSLRA